MFCSKCGAQNPDGAQFCQACGAPLAAAPAAPQPQQPQQPPVPPVPEQPPVPPAPEQAPQQPQQPYGQWQQPQQQPQQPYGQWQQPQDTYGLPMNWHKFLIYFALWAGGILNIISGILTFTGKQYELYGDTPAEWVYAFFDGLKQLDMFYGIVLLALGVLCIVDRFQLAGFKRIGPKLLLVLYAANLVLGIIYVVAASKITGLEISDMADSRTVASLVMSAVMVVVNAIYYKKRAHLFVN